MIDIPRREIRDMRNLVLFKVPEGLKIPDKPCMEEWYSSDNEQFGRRGVYVGDQEVLRYAEVVASGLGIHLRGFQNYGWALEEKFYDHHSYLLNGVIITAGKRREYFGGGNKIKVSDSMPESILKIISESKERLLDTANSLKLPILEKDKIS